MPTHASSTMDAAATLPSAQPEHAVRRRLLQFAGLAMAGSLAACGGPSGADIAACVITNCKSSEDVDADDLNVGGSLRRESGQVSASIRLGYRANLLTVVRLKAPDALWLMPGQVELTPVSDVQDALVAQAADSRSDWTLRLRHRGKDYDSTFLLPAPVRIQTPAPATVLRSQGAFASTLSAPSGLASALSLADATCQLADGRTTQWSGYRSGPRVSLLGASGELQQFGVDVEALQEALDHEATSSLSTNTGKVSVKQCRVGLVWEFSREGSVAAGLSRHGMIRAISQARQVVSYVNDR